MMGEASLDKLIIFVYRMIINLSSLCVCLFYFLYYSAIEGAGCGFKLYMQN